jgi:hypothetical protein
MDYQAQWVAHAGTYMMNVKNCSLFYCHIHIFDHINHRHLSGIDPASPGYNESSAPEHWEIYRKAYMTADRMIGTIMKEVDLNTTNVIVASDHAAIPDKRAINMRKFLVERGFLSVKDPDAGLNNDVVENENIDWEHTKAFMKPGRGYDIFINADEGTKEYTDIQNELIRTLRTWVDNVTGDCPVAIALRKKDAPLLGFWSNQCGDVVFVNEDGYVHGYMGEWHHILEEKSLGEPFWYGAHHGTQLPTSRTSIASNMAFLLASGPGIKKGYERPVDELGYLHMTSIVPLICHLLEIETPAQCQGYLPRDILESQPEALARRFDYPEWEPGTRPGGWGNRIQIQKDMFDFVSNEDK